MNIIRLYQNFWIRNSIIIVVCLLVIFGCVYDTDPEIDETNGQFLWTFVKISRGFFPLYIAMIFSNMVLVRKLLFQKKYTLFIAFFLLYWTLYYIGIQYYYDFVHMRSETLLAVQLGKVSLLLTVIAISNGTALYFLHLWILRNISESRKAQMNIETELSFLKQQLNPHFLLNAMNNLYGESLSEPESVPDRILNLSDLLRYQIEATKKNLVPLQDEMDFVKRYLAYCSFSNERLEVHQEYIGETDGIEIPPLFFLPLVENAVKFSRETLQPQIRFEFEVSGKNLSFSIENNFLEVGSRLNGTGIGLGNLERRLEVYGLKHELVYGKENGLFTIKLQLWELHTVA
ncbi:hypothetical protein FNO01nite_18000 [Flavobacterium noncentrifugens]|uniref:Histidine kinase n=1 Tax=Flavobacterium noncentrifugens TaxID=1128970 RepID=A0A1G8Y8F9_9FLAO|nr:histidine kinase [Flavobacterium noncentrifugens]GEP51128.1 hypothetical protein FNO01nite_18000 [Flavobacterium noncentrifugens]SDJ99112.1 Histidine kinase [Flavobacterium noncentrifugens]